MEIRKADSKGRVTGFEPGKNYAVDYEKGWFAEVVPPNFKFRTIYKVVQEEGELPRVEIVSN